MNQLFYRFLCRPSRHAIQLPFIYQSPLSRIVPIDYRCFGTSCSFPHRFQPSSYLLRLPQESYGSNVFHISRLQQSSYLQYRHSSSAPKPPTINRTQISISEKCRKKSEKYLLNPTVKFVKLSSLQIYNILVSAKNVLVQLVLHPSIVITWYKLVKDSIKHGWNWTKSGFKIFGANFKISLLLLKKKIKGQPLTFREHKLLVQTTADLVKLVPFSFFVVVPFAELLLPIALWIFPGMLPSTFSEKQIDRPQLQRKLKAKQELAQFFQEMVAERTRQVLDKTTSERFRDRAQMLKQFQEKLILKAEEEAKLDGSGDHAEIISHVEVNPFLSLKDTLTYAKLFKEEFRIEKMPTKALMVVCKMLGIQPYEIRANVILQLRCGWTSIMGSSEDSILFCVVRYYILRLQREDREILWEGVETLTHEELVDACKERAMRFYGVSDDIMREQMRQWLELSSHKDIPPLLLLWSRSITMTHSSEKIEEELPKETTVLIEDTVNPESETVIDGLLPVVEVEEEKTFEEKVEENIKERDEELKAKIEEVDKRLEELRSEVEVLQGESGNTEPLTETVLRSDKVEEILIDHAEVLDQSHTDRSRLGKEELLRKCDKLESEMSVMKEISDLQYKHIDMVIKTLAGVIDEYRRKETNDKREIEDFVGRVEELLKLFEESVSELSEKLESAKCIRLSTDDEVFYPDGESTNDK